MKRVMELVLIMGVGVSICSILSGCGYAVKVDHEANCDPSVMHTYNWSPTQNRAVDPKLDDKYLDCVITRAVDEELKSKGYCRVNSDSPNFWATYCAGLGCATQRFVEYNDAYSRIEMYTGDYDLDLPWRTYDVTFPEGTFVLDFYGAGQPRPYWRGTGKTRLDMCAYEKKQRHAQIRDAVKTVMKDFPERNKCVQ